MIFILHYVLYNVLMLLFVYCRKESQQKVSVHIYLYVYFSMLCVVVVVVAIKRETEQFVRAVAQRFPGQEAPVSYIVQCMYVNQAPLMSPFY